MTSTQEFIAQHRGDDVNTLALSLAGHPEAAFILRQVEGWQRLRHKVPTWAHQPLLHYPPRLSLEQCSSEAAAEYKCSIVRRLLPAAHSFADLTGGFGVDFAFIARLFQRATYVEQNAELSRLARHNLPLLGLERAEIVQQSADVFLPSLPDTDLLFLDPARRAASGRKVVALADCSPDVTALWPTLLQKARYVMLKLSPMLDITALLRTLPHIAEIHVVGSGGECKELLCVASAAVSLQVEPTVFCREDGFCFSFLPSEEKAACITYASFPATYLYDPAAVVLKAGALRLLCARYALHKLSPQSHLYFSDRYVARFPGRAFRVEAVTGCGKRDTAQLRGTAANLAVRGFPATASVLKTKWHLRDGGSQYLFACQDVNGKKVLVRATRLDVR